MVTSVFSWRTPWSVEFSPVVGSLVDQSLSVMSYLFSLISSFHPKFDDVLIPLEHVFIYITVT